MTDDAVPPPPADGEPSPPLTPPSPPSFQPPAAPPQPPAAPPATPTFQPAAAPPQPPATPTYQPPAAPPQPPAAPPPSPPTFQPPAAPPATPTFQPPAAPPQPPGAPTYQTPPPAAAPPQSPGGYQPPTAGPPMFVRPGDSPSGRSNTWGGVDKTLLTVTGFVGGAAVLLSTLTAWAGRDGDSETAAFVIGGAFGVALLIGLVGLAVWHLASPKAGTITALVISALVLLTNITQFAETSSERRQVNEAAEAAIEASGRTPRNSSFEPTRAEEQCVEDEGVNSDQLLTAFTDTSVEGSNAQTSVIDALLFCAPRLANDDSFLDGMRVGFSEGVGGEVNVDEMRCVTNYLVDNAADPRAVFGGADQFIVLDASDECLRQELLDTLYGVAGTGPQSVGDDPIADLFFDRCAIGNGAACDVLFVLTSTDSEYQELALDCGGRPYGGDIFCQAGFFDGDNDGFADIESPGWSEMTERCTGGDMIACDFTYQMSPIGAPTERVGETCGGRSPLAVIGCVERFGEFADE